MTDTLLAPDEVFLEQRPRHARHPILHTLSAAMRHVLIAHLNERQPISVNTKVFITTTVLCRRGLLRFDGHKNPRFSELTDKGRDAACACAEAEATTLLEMEGLR